MLGRREGLQRSRDRFVRRARRLCRPGPTKCRTRRKQSSHCLAWYSWKFMRFMQLERGVEHFVEGERFVIHVLIRFPSGIRSVPQALDVLQKSFDIFRSGGVVFHFGIGTFSAFGLCFRRVALGIWILGTFHQQRNHGQAIGQCFIFKTARIPTFLGKLGAVFEARCPVRTKRMLALHRLQVVRFHGLQHFFGQQDRWNRLTTQ
jgi:hypothetical protein